MWGRGEEREGEKSGSEKREGEKWGREKSGRERYRGVKRGRKEEGEGEMRKRWINRQIDSV